MSYVCATNVFQPLQFSIISTHLDIKLLLLWYRDWAVWLSHAVGSVSALCSHTNDACYIQHYTHKCTYRKRRNFRAVKNSTFTESVSRNFRPWLIFRPMGMVAIKHVRTAIFLKTRVTQIFDFLKDGPVIFYRSNISMFTVSLVL